jgi:DNA-directed RNA polymerase subunit M/transcription elongation factor TFIIS
MKKCKNCGNILLPREEEECQECEIERLYNEGL